MAWKPYRLERTSAGHRAELVAFCCNDHVECLVAVHA